MKAREAEKTKETRKDKAADVKEAAEQEERRLLAAEQLVLATNRLAAANEDLADAQEAIATSLLRLAVTIKALLRHHEGDISNYISDASNTEQEHRRHKRARR